MMKSLILATIGASTVASAFALPRWIKRAAYTDGKISCLISLAKESEIHTNIYSADVLNYALTLEHLGAYFEF